jgi:6-phosphogluconolactonase
METVPIESTPSTCTIDGMNRTPTLHVVESAAEIASFAADFVVKRAQAAVAERGRFVVALAGGGTPKPVYEQLASPERAGAVDWDRVHVFFGDERCVPPADEQSNFRMAREALLERVPLPESNIHRILGEVDPEIAAVTCEQQLKRLFRCERPSIHLVLLGIGGDGHTASLFPGTAAVRERERLVVAQYVDKMRSWRVTFTPVLLDAAREVLFLAEGSGKADVIREILLGAYQPDVLPSQRVQPHAGHVHWCLDRAAATGVRETFSSPARS